MNRKTLIIIIIVVGLVTLGFIWFRFSRSGVTTDMEGNIVTDQRSFFGQTSDEVGSPPTHDGDESMSSTQSPGTSASNAAGQTKILITDGVKHSVPLDEILSGGPPQDGIPPIDNPQFESVAQADTYLDPNGLGIGYVSGGVERFYPFQILVWHEIVNDTVNGQRVLVTYCPLCGTGMVFDPLVKGERVEFGTSGKLYNSDLVMYDRLTNSYWSQIEAAAIVGEMTGATIELLPADNVTWADWKRDHPNSQILSRDTGHARNYSTSPYGDYDTNASVFFPVANQNGELHPKDWVYGVEVNGQFKAYRYQAFDQDTVLTELLGGQSIRVEYNHDLDVIKVFDTATDREIVGVRSFWFAWYAFHPDTALYDPSG